ncbi:MAG: hypothetical protein SPH93_13135 [Clostridium sp.]|nr:hypothetical protein [Clostridium sp.]MDY6228579.1 hypothetical protein [Clostridium sp.]
MKSIVKEINLSETAFVKLLENNRVKLSGKAIIALKEELYL